MKQHHAARRSVRGVTLIEIMISLVLGLIVVGAGSVMFAATRQANRTGTGMSRMQESVRTGYELLAREVRETGGVPCDRNLRVVNVLNNADAQWWSSWGNVVDGFDDATASTAVAFGVAVGQRVAGTDLIILRYGNTLDDVTVVSHNPPSAEFKLNTTNHGLVDGDIVMVCDYFNTSIVQLTNASSSNVNIVHNAGAGSPGNCTKGLGWPRKCTALGTAYQYTANSRIARMTSVAWFVGNNGRPETGGRSLYRLPANGTPQEVAEGVRNMQISYLPAGATDYVDATAVTDWTGIVAVRFVLTLESPNTNVTSDSTPQRLTRTVRFSINLRNLVT